MAKVTTLYEDSAKTEALYPRTKVSAVSDGNNVSLEELLQNVNTDLVNLGTLSDLNLDKNSLKTFTTYVGRTNDNTLNRPDIAGNALVFYVTSNYVDYGRMLYISDGGIYTRGFKAGAWLGWYFLFRNSPYYETATLNSTYFSGGELIYMKVGNIVTTVLNSAILKTNVGSGVVTNIMSGLPAPTKAGEPFLLQQYGTDQAWRVTLNADGSIQSHYDAQSASGSQWYGSFTYVAKES